MRVVMTFVITMKNNYTANDGTQITMVLNMKNIYLNQKFSVILRNFSGSLNSVIGIWHIHKLNMKYCRIFQQFVCVVIDWCVQIWCSVKSQDAYIYYYMEGIQSVLCEPKFVMNDCVWKGYQRSPSILICIYSFG